MAYRHKLFLFWQPRQVFTPISKGKKKEDAALAQTKNYLSILRFTSKFLPIFVIFTGLDFLFHMFFLVKYSKSLEEGSFRNRSADFLWMLLVGAAILITLGPFVNVQFLGSSLAFMMVYVWGRRHPRLPLSFLGIFSFSAAYLPWVLLAFSVMLGSSPAVDLLGMAAGHTYYFLEDVYPHTSTGRRLLKTPAMVKALFPQEQQIQRAQVPPQGVLQQQENDRAQPAADNDRPHQD